MQSVMVTRVTSGHTLDLACLAHTFIRSLIRSPSLASTMAAPAKVEYVLLGDNPPAEQRRKELYDRFRVFKWWVPEYLSIRAMGVFTVKYTPDGEWQNYDPKTVDEEFPDKDPVVLLGVKPSYGQIGQMGYLYGFKAKAKEDQDEIDEDFVAHPEKLEKFEFYGLHTYGGYYGFFRPDLSEVIELTSSGLPPSEEIECAFVTTEPHPSDKGSECYDRSADRHRAKTTVYVKRTRAASRN